MATGGKRHTGVVKSFKGSFGWISCPDVAAEFGGRDTFLHKKSINTLPTVGSKVTFRVALDPKGNPKAEDAVLEAKTVEAVDCAPKSQICDKQQGMRVCRAALMLTRNDNDEILVMREHKEGQLRWSDLGGKVEEGEELLECALRELAEESQAFLSGESVALLSTGLRQRYGHGRDKPELVTLGGGGERPQGVAVFRMDCTGCEEELAPLEQAGPNQHDVYELRWLRFSDPVLRDRHHTRWPLLRVLCALGEKGGPRGGASGSRNPLKSRSRSRSRSPAAAAAAAAAMARATATATKAAS